MALTTPPAPDPIDIAIGARIRFRRHELGLTQDELCERSGMSYQQLQRYERGKHRPVVANLFRLARHLETTLTWLVGESDQSPIERSILDGLAHRDAPTLLAAYAGLTDPPMREPLVRLVEALAETAEA